jgi:dTDP-4-amino-4,6-dideoxygalactose transaminase
MFLQFKNLILAIISTAALSEALLINPVSKKHTLDHTRDMILPTSSSRTFMPDARCIKTPDPIPEAGQREALELMKSGRLYRYSVKSAEDSVVSRCEKEIADYMGHKYCIGLNSCGSALMLLLKTTGLKPGGKVISNAFTFGAVPSAIEHAGGKAIYVESTMDMIIDIGDLERQLLANPDCQHVLISHMRGKVADMQSIEELCTKYDAILLEDCAHSLGVLYKHRHTGHSGVACAISSQSYKMINSGEGGFLLTNDPDIAAQTAVYAGAYEALSHKHMSVPPQRYFKDYPKTLPNYSLRMSQLSAAVIRPQIETLDERINIYNKRYKKLQRTIEKRVGDHVSIPKLTPEVTRMVHDSFQFNLDTKFTPQMVEHFLNECSMHGLLVELFGHQTNARNFVNWEFAPACDPLPKTAAMLARACDVRMPLMWEDEDFDDMADVIVESVEKVLSEHGCLE